MTPLPLPVPKYNYNLTNYPIIFKQIMFFEISLSIKFKEALAVSQLNICVWLVQFFGQETQKIDDVIERSKIQKLEEN